MSRPECLWSAAIRVGDIPESGLTVKLQADERTRAEVAAAAGVDAVERLEVAADLVLRAGGGVHVVGIVSATVQQTCVVTLEAVINEVAEAIDLVFAPRSGDAGREAAMLDDGDCVETPEPLVGDAVDLGAAATELLILGIDPYPRKPGAVFESPQDTGDKDTPFAALATLKYNRRNPDD
jgi:uncharacterized metal-binding protein YceD (DUF177 family)